VRPTPTKSWSPRSSEGRKLHLTARGGVARERLACIEVFAAVENDGRNVLGLEETALNFWPLGRSGVVFAHRVTFDARFGQAPLMALGEFGGLFPMDAYGGAFVGRSFARRRFIGKTNLRLEEANPGTDLRNFESLLDHAVAELSLLNGDSLLERLQLPRHFHLERVHHTPPVHHDVCHLRLATTTTPKNTAPPRTSAPSPCLGW